MRVPDEVLKCVVFIGHTVGGQHILMGTGFFVGIESEALDGRMFCYLVTAKHVADKVAGNFWVRQNKTDGGVARVQAEIDWFYHPSDPSADVAVVPWKVPDELDHLVVPSAMILTSRAQIEERSIGIGDEVFLAGVFSSAQGKDRNTPILRKGNLAMLPEDKTPTKDLGLVDAYLIEAHSFGGISGSPIFVRETITQELRRKSKVEGERGEPVRVTMGGHFYLLGLMHGHWEIEEEDLNAVYMRKPRREELGVNLGISIAIPGAKIMETVNHPKLAAARAYGERMALAQRAMPTPDSVTGEPEAPKSGPEPETLAIDLPMDDAVKKMFEAGKPPKEG